MMYLTNKARQVFNTPLSNQTIDRIGFGLRTTATGGLFTGIVLGSMGLSATAAFLTVAASVPLSGIGCTFSSEYKTFGKTAYERLSMAGRSWKFAAALALGLSTAVAGMDLLVSNDIHTPKAQPITPQTQNLTPPVQSR